MAIAVNTRKFTVDEYHKMFNVGILTEKERTELITGQIISISPIGFKEATCINRLFTLLSYKLEKKATVFSQVPLKLNDNSELQPDLAILKYREDLYHQQSPQTEDILSIIEVAENTLDLDQHIKIPLYASANIPEVWIIDLNSDCVDIYRHIVDGKYQEIRRITTGKNISILAFNHIILSGMEILENQLWCDL